MHLINVKEIFCHFLKMNYKIKRESKLKELNQIFNQEIRPKLKKLFVQKQEYEKYKQIKNMKFYYEKKIIAYDYLWCQNSWKRKRSKLIKFTKNKMEKQYENQFNSVKKNKMDLKSRKEKHLGCENEKIRQLKFIKDTLKRKLNKQGNVIDYLLINRKELQNFVLGELYLLKKRKTKQQFELFKIIVQQRNNSLIIKKLEQKKENLNIVANYVENEITRRKNIA
jgi:hypothetical protein